MVRVMGHVLEERAVMRRRSWCGGERVGGGCEGVLVACKSSIGESKLRTMMSRHALECRPDSSSALYASA